MQIHKKLLDTLYSYVFNHPVEVCGFLYEQRGVYDTLAIDQGVILNERGMCTPSPYSTKTNFKFHTHPVSSYAYPSFEDLLTVMKPRPGSSRMSSLICTIWGSWIILPGKNPIDESTLEENNANYEQSIGYLHYQQKGTTSKSKPYDATIQSIIDAYISNVEALFSQYLTIRFVPWHNVKTFTINLEVATLGMKRRRSRRRRSTKMKSFRRR